MSPRTRAAMRPLTLALLCGLALPLLPGAASAQETQPRLTVTGEGQASATPDMATVTIGVSATAPEAGPAMDAASESARAILDRLDSLGIDPRDRQTSDLSLQPIWSDGGPGVAPTVTGYEAGNMLTVRVRALDSLGDVLAAVTSDGANRLSGLTFGLQDPDPVMEEARRDAVADAMARAEVLADAAGVTLGPVIEMSEQGGGYAPKPMMEMRAASAPPVASGEATMSARVNMVFGLGGEAAE